MKSTSIRALFSLTLLLSVSSAFAKTQNIPVIVAHSPYESENVLKDTLQKGALSGGVGLIEGAVAQKLFGADQILVKAVNGDATAILETIGLGLVLWKTGHMAREQLQDGAAKNKDGFFQETICTLLGFAGFGAGMKLAK